jgi:signal transduction histidine kinase
MQTQTNFIGFMERNFGIIAVLAEDGGFVHGSQDLVDAAGLRGLPPPGQPLNDLLIPESSEALRAGMRQAAQGEPACVPFVASASGSRAVRMFLDRLPEADGGGWLLWADARCVHGGIRGPECAALGEREEHCRIRVAKLERELDVLADLVIQRRQGVETLAAWAERSEGNWAETRPWLERILNALPDEYVVIDKDRTVVMTSHSDQSLGRKCHSVFFKRERQCADCCMARLEATKKPTKRVKARAHRHLEVHEIPIINDRGKLDFLVMVYRDVTEGEHCKIHLQRASRLASLGQLVSGVGHEINNPNQFIRGNIKIVKQALTDMLPILDEYHQSHPGLRIARLDYGFLREHLMTLVDDMAHGSERIKGIVEGLRHFAHEDEGLMVDRVDVNPLVEGCVRLVGKEVSKRAQLEISLGDDIPTFNGNNQKIEQILVNLIVNASQAMPDDRRGTVWVSTSFEDPEVIIEVRDDGKGMTERTLEKIFDPFFTTKRATGGTGLGLAITHRAVEEHGGTISVSSKPGLGTSIAIRIPMEALGES